MIAHCYACLRDSICRHCFTCPPKRYHACSQTLESFRVLCSMCARYMSRTQLKQTCIQKPRGLDQHKTLSQIHTYLREPRQLARQVLLRLMHVRRGVLARPRRIVQLRKRRRVPRESAR